MIKEKLILYVDMDGVLCDFYSAHKKALIKNPHNKFPQSEYGFFLNLKSIDGAIKSMNWIIKSKVFDVYILTAPSVMNPLCYIEKRLWVEAYFGMEMVNKLIITPNKSLNKGDYLIDDNTSGRGQDGFEGELIHFGSDKFKNWSDITLYLNKQ